MHTNETKLELFKLHHCKFKMLIVIPKAKSMTKKYTEKQRTNKHAWEARVTEPEGLQPRPAPRSR